MDAGLFGRLAKAVCLYFDDTCAWCPFYGFRESVGATSCAEAWHAYRKEAEIVLAKWIAGGTTLAPLDEPAPQKEPRTRREILQAAERCVCGDRDASYGGPEDSFALIARLWEPIIRARCVSPGADVTVDAVTVALLMAELKIARAATNSGHMDSWVDLAGYAACGGEIAAREADKNAQV